MRFCPPRRTIQGDAEGSLARACVSTAGDLNGGGFADIVVNAWAEFVGEVAFSGRPRELHYIHDGGNTYVEGDTDGDGDADFVIRLDGLHTLAGIDFVL